MKKIAMQQLADSLNLSRVTVWKALNNRPGVSPETARRVQDAVKSLQRERIGIPGQVESSAESPRVRNVTLLASNADTNSFWMQIVDQIASELNRRRIQLHYLSADSMRLRPSELSSMIQPGQTDGVIIVNIYEEELISALQSIPLPKVFFDTVPGHTAQDLQGDLLLLEGRRTVGAVTGRLIQKGCRRIGFIGDVQYAYTNRLRWEGFLEGLELSGLPAEPDICLARSIEKDAYRDSIGAFLDGIPAMPDAFVCVSDFVAFVTLNLLEERGFRVPDDLLLSGYDDSREFLLDRRGVTTVHVQNALLGRRLVNQLLYRIETPQADFEEIQILPKIFYRE